MTVQFCGLHMQVGIIKRDSARIEIIDLEDGRTVSCLTAGVKAPSGCIYVDSGDQLVKRVAEQLVSDGVIEPIPNNKFSIFPMYRLLPAFHCLSERS